MRNAVISSTILLLSLFIAIGGPLIIGSVIRRWISGIKGLKPMQTSEPTKWRKQSMYFLGALWLFIYLIAFVTWYVFYPIIAVSEF